ncbi:cytochrome c oxidase accessory protein CcoG [Pseudovibrio sp. Tun.PSC04-5.I4]|uniref:cytochrome c oxidase accessory protein CcoG n=1 Tax=Pseudovibrio sp. Tun.PSC04-5.I4 TaxID=1798213 RepID=UPI000B8518E4
MDVNGRFRKIKWAILFITLGIYYFTPFIRWDRGPLLPDQAVLVDFERKRGYFFFLEIWPQEVYYLTGLLILAAVGLFLMNAIAGRLWCGYLCPQTVWTDLFFKIESLIEGDRRKRIALDKEPWSASKILKKGTKHFLWIMVAWWTGGAWVLYFSDAPTLVYDLATGAAAFSVYLWIGILTFTTYSLAGHMREQVCVYMCPWPRIQAALTDEHALNVTYRYDRGEPRGHLKESKKRTAEGLPAGDCIDCNQCYFACPTGVDIRKGAQLDCIQCGLCIDACDSIMTKVGKPTGLIAYDTDDNIERREKGEEPVYRLIRPRTVIYAAIILLIMGAMLYAQLNRSMTGLSVVHDRNPLYVQQNDGSFRNGYSLRLLNKHNKEQYFTLSVEGMPVGTKLEVVGVSKDGVAAANATKLQLGVDADTTRSVRALVFSPSGEALPASRPMGFKLIDMETGETTLIEDFFRAPGT